MNRLNFTYSLIIAVVVTIYSSNQESTKDENGLNKFYSDVLQKLDEIKESSASFQKAFKESTDTLEQLKQKQLETEQALNKIMRAIHLLTDYPSSKFSLGELLISAITNEDIKQVKLLLEVGAPVEYQNSEKNRPIHLAVIHRQLQILEDLLEHKADIESKGVFDQSALVMTSFVNCVECAKILLDKGADLGSRDQWGNTAMVHSCRSGYKEYIELLLSRGADINEVQSGGMSGLHWAARDGHLPIVIYLVEKGADVNLKTNAGLTPLDEALASNHPLVADYLRSIKKN